MNESKSPYKDQKNGNLREAQAGTDKRVERIPVKAATYRLDHRWLHADVSTGEAEALINEADRKDLQASPYDSDYQEVIDDRVDIHRVYRSEYWQQQIHGPLGVCWGSGSAQNGFRHIQVPVLRNARNVAVIVDAGQLEPHRTGTDLLDLRPQSFGEKVKHWPTNEHGWPLCATEPFRDQPSFRRSCTGFMITPRLLVTAGHCFWHRKEARWLSSDEIKNLRIVFDFQLPHAGASGVPLHQRMVFRIEEVLEVNYNPHYRDHPDWAIFRLDRDYEGFRPMKRRTRGSVWRDPVYLLGHPLGLPKKFAPGGHVQVALYTRDYFKTNLDAFRGNSGSPVYNCRTHELEGILVSGEKTEFVADPEEQCIRTRVCGINECAMEKVLRITSINERLEHYMKQS